MDNSNKQIPEMKRQSYKWQEGPKYAREERKPLQQMVLGKMETHMLET